LGPIKSHNASISSVAYSPDGIHFTSSSLDSTICIWEGKTGQVVLGPLKEHSASVHSVAYSPDGKHVVSGSDDYTMYIWDAETGSKAIGPLTAHTIVYSVAYSPDGKYIVSGLGDQTISIWNAETGQVVSGPLKGHNGSVVSVAYSPNGKHIVSASSDSTICIWDAEGQVALGSLDKNPGQIGSSINEGSVFIPTPIQPDCHWHHYAPSPTTQPYCQGCTWGFTKSSRISDGWITGPNSELIFWVPHHNRDSLLIPSVFYRLGRLVPTKLAFGQFEQGSSWTKCLTQH
jgi:WD40 repeat protein